MSPRGKAWAAYWRSHGHDWQGRPQQGMNRVDDSDAMDDPRELSLIQRAQKALGARVLRAAVRNVRQKQPVFEAGVDRVDRAELPDYNNNPPCMHGVNKPMPKV